MTLNGFYHDRTDDCRELSRCDCVNQLEENKMAYVEMILTAAQDENRWFGCQWATWDLMRELAEANGWCPRGTQPPPRQSVDWEKHGGFQATYCCEDFPLVKLVTREDAWAWAEALEKAAQAMGGDLHPLSGPGTRVLSDRYPLEVWGQLQYGVRAGFLRRFAAFLRRGEFTFLWEDGAGPLPRNEDQGPIADWFEFAVCADLAHDFEGAEKAYLELTRLAPGELTIWLNLGLIYRRQGLHAQAIAAHEQATKVAPESWDAWQFLGNSLLEAERFEEAAAALKNAVQLGPEQASCWSALGNALSRAHAFLESDAAHRQALELAPEDPRWASNFAENLKAQGELESAIQFLIPWARRYPNLGAMQENLGVYLMAVKRFAEALPYLEKASALDPKNSDLFRRQVICLLEQGDPIRTKQALLSHLALEPGFKPGWGLLLQLEPSADEKAQAERALKADN